jgi:hypothetical protein
VTNAAGAGLGDWARVSSHHAVANRPNSARARLTHPQAANPAAWPSLVNSLNMPKAPCHRCCTGRQAKTKSGDSLRTLTA